jgi:hypothetical protein
VRISTTATFDIETGECLHRESYEYEGPVANCGGGPSVEQRNAANQQQQLNQQQAAIAQQQQQFAQKQQDAVSPFYSDMMTQGLPYYQNLVDSAGGNVARSFAPARAQLERVIAQGPNAMPSGFATGARMDLASQQGRAFDDQLQSAQAANFQAKQAGAAGMTGQAQIANPQGWYSQASQGNSSIMQAPLATPSVLGGIGGILGGVSGMLKNKTPF